MFYQKLLQDVRSKTNDDIYYGPFSTLKIPESHFPHLSIGEILGTYEYAIQPYIYKVISKQPQSVMIVGANMGYYCAGLSYTINPDILIAYEIEQHLQQLSKAWWKVNKLGNLDMRGKATKEDFLNIQNSIDFILCDCEGEEINLLNPNIFHWQKQSTILVEIHDFYQPNLLQILVSRFTTTHNITIIQDDIAENELNHTLLKSMSKWYWLAKRKISTHPNHRWIMRNNKKILTFGRFIFMEPK